MHGDAIVQVTYDHEGVTLLVAKAPWLRGVVLMGAVFSLVPAGVLAGLLALAPSSVPLATNVAMMSVLYGLLLAGVAARWRTPTPSLVALLALTTGVLGATNLIIAATGFGAGALALSLCQLIAASNMLYNAMWATKDSQIRLTGSYLQFPSTWGATALALEDIETLDVEYGLLILGMRDGRFERAGDGLPSSTLNWLAKRVDDAAMRRRQTAVDFAPPPEQLLRLMSRAT